MKREKNYYLNTIDPKLLYEKRKKNWIQLYCSNTICIPVSLSYLQFETPGFFSSSLDPFAKKLYFQQYDLANLKFFPKIYFLKNKLLKILLQHKWNKTTIKVTYSQFVFDKEN